MSFTTVDIVKKHILEKQLGPQSIADEQIRPIGLGPVQLRFPPVIADSETVKAIAQIKPDFQSAAFDNNNIATLTKSHLVSDSLVVASDSSLGRVYTENVDYLIDYKAGLLTRLASGAIPQNASVAVWYLPYRPYTRNVDYRLNCAKGEIVRLSSGNIFSGQNLTVDYDTEAAGIDDDIIENAINEANDQVLNFIDPANENSADRSLVVGETYLAMAILCRIKAMENFGSGGGSVWRSLAEEYKRDGYLILNKFANSFKPFAPPKKA